MKNKPLQFAKCLQVIYQRNAEVTAMVKIADIHVTKYMDDDFKRYYDSNRNIEDAIKKWQDEMKRLETLAVEEAKQLFTEWLKKK